MQLTPQQEARNNKAHQSGDGNLFGGKPANPITGESNQAKPKNQRSKHLPNFLNYFALRLAKRNFYLCKGGFNPITGQSYGEEDSDRQNRVDKHEAKQAKEASDKAAEVSAAATVKLAEEQERQQQVQNKPIHTSTKVHQPPGGKSTALW